MNLFRFHLKKGLLYFIIFYLKLKEFNFDYVIFWFLIRDFLHARLRYFLSKIYISYNIKFRHSEFNPGKIYCIGYSTDINSIPNKICQGETGIIENLPGTNNDAYVMWPY